jgi:hypothetical protein
MWSKFARYFLLVLSILSILMALNWLYVDVAPMLDSLGETNGTNCDTRGDFPSVPNGNGMVATGHSTGCAIVLLSMAFTTYVYVHKVGESESAKTLVFRFDESFGSSEDPQIVWSDASNLHISISKVDAVTKQLTSINGVKISYSIGKEGVSLEEVERGVRHDAGIALVWLIFAVGVFIRYLKRSAAKISPTAELAISAILVAFIFVRFLPILRILFE